MTMASGRFSGGGGGGGGSNRDVVFTARVDTKDARRELSALAKDVDAVQKRMGSMRVGGPGGWAGAGRGGGAVSAPSIVFGDSSFDRQHRSFFDRAIREEQRAVKQAAQERMRDLKSLKKDTKDVMDGMIGLTRAFVLFGVSSEENLEKAVRALAKFEGAVSGIKGGMKLSEGLGGLLGRGAQGAGIAAGGSTTALGAAGIAAGVGLLGGGAAIYDQIQYLRTGRIGAYSQGYASAATGLAGTLSGYGIDPRKRSFAGFLANQLPGVGLLGSGGFYDAADSSARAGATLQSSLTSAGSAMETSQQRLGIERDILAIMEREAAVIKSTKDAADQRRAGAAMTFAGLSAWDQRGVTQLRNRFLSNPESLSNRELIALQPYVGANENAQIQSRVQGRLPAGFRNRGFAGESEADFRAAGESGLRPGAVQIQREVVLNLTIDNQGAMEIVEGMVQKALDSQDAALRAMAERFERELNARMKRNDQQRQLGLDAQSVTFGGGF